MIKNLTVKLFEEVIPKTLKTSKKMKINKLPKELKSSVFLRRSSSDITPASCLQERKNKDKCSCAVYQNQKSCTIRYDEKDEEYILNLIFFAIQYKNTELLLQICEQSQINLNVLNKDGISALHFAAIVCSTECMEILKQHGACYNLRDIRGQIAMHYYRNESQCQEVSAQC